MYRQGTNPFAHPRGSSLYFCMMFDCYVICGLFVGVIAYFLLIKVRAHAFISAKLRIYFENHNILPSVL